jgi:hypothetical protein
MSLQIPTTSNSIIFARSPFLIFYDFIKIPHSELPAMPTSILDAGGHGRCPNQPGIVSELGQKNLGFGV